MTEYQTSPEYTGLDWSDVALQGIDILRHADKEIARQERERSRSRDFNGRRDAGTWRTGALPRLIDPRDWQGVPVPETQWLVKNWIPWKVPTLITGDGGLGKSMLAMQLLASVALGRDWLGLETTPVKAFGLFCEDDAEELHRRFDRATAHLGADFSALDSLRLMCGVCEDCRLVDHRTGNPAPFYHRLLEMLIDERFRLVVLDSLHDLFDGNENVRPEANRFVNLLRRIAIEINGPVVINAHPSLSGMASGSGAFGSTAWSNTVRTRLYLTRPEVDADAPANKDVRILSSKKSNYGPSGHEIRIKWAGGVFHAETREYVSAREIEARFMKCLDRLHAQGRPPTNAPNSPRYAPKEMHKMPEAGSASRAELARAMERLFSSDAIKVGSIPGPDRHGMKAIVRADAEAEPDAEQGPDTDCDSGANEAGEGSPNHGPEAAIGPAGSAGSDSVSH